MPVVVVVVVVVGVKMMDDESVIVSSIGCGEDDGWGGLIITKIMEKKIRVSHKIV